MSKSTLILILLVILIFGAGIIGFFVYKNYQDIHKKTEVVEKTDIFEATEAGRGIGDFAICPEGKEVISGGCSSESAPLKFVLSTQQPWKSRQKAFCCLDHADNFKECMKHLKRCNPGCCG